MKNKMMIWLAGVAAFTACAEEVYNAAQPQHATTILITENNGMSRTAYSGLSATFETGDVVGIYAVDADNTVLANNIRCTYDGTSWVLDSDVPYSPSYRYYAYAPYTATPYSPDFTQEDIGTIFADFLTDSSNKFHRADQSSKAAFQASDLMIAEGVPETYYAVAFTMNHQKGRLSFDIAQDGFTGNLPYDNGTEMVYLVKPGVTTAVAGENYLLTAGEHRQVRFLDERIKSFLTFTALESGTFTLTIPAAVNTSCVTSVSYSLDDGETWVTTANSASDVTITTPTVPAGGRVLWKGVASQYCESTGAYWSNFSSTGTFDVSGNIMSLLYDDDFRNKRSLTGLMNTFKFLFRYNDKVVHAENLSMPAKTLKQYCYHAMFQGCTNLVSAPDLPSPNTINYCYNSMFMDCTNLIKVPDILPAMVTSGYCYQNMFANCTSLTNAPELPATTLVSNCYSGMFSGCSSLTKAPDILPAMAAAHYCCAYMFKDCTSLTRAPKLPATTTGVYCYLSMFQGCTALTEAPELPALTATEGCYTQMFSGCTALEKAPELPATTVATSCYSSMFQGCTSLTKAPSVLPAITLYNSSYNRMFFNCRSMTTAPELPATTLAPYCYFYMFAGCNNINVAPELPAKTLATSCYCDMFVECTGLTKAPNLPATTLADNCYAEMFRNCYNMTDAPSVLPATTLKNNCYISMFANCRSLTAAPELPATTLVQGCYNQMLGGCIKLNYVKAAFTTEPSATYTNYWLSSVAASGTFVKNSAATWDVTGTSGIPSGWTVETYTP